MEYKTYELVRESRGNSARWHVYTPEGHRLTSAGFRTITEAKRFCTDRDVRRIGAAKIRKGER